MTPRYGSYMTQTQQQEVRFTAKRACIWNGKVGRWITISRDTATAMIATGEAVELKAGQWI